VHYAVSKIAVESLGFLLRILAVSDSNLLSNTAFAVIIHGFHHQDDCPDDGGSSHL
jgi:hypothetical protein